MAKRKINPVLDEEEVFDVIMLMAKNDGEAYRNNKNATQAVDTAITQFRKDVGTEAREETKALRARAISDLNAYWKSRNNNPCECMQLHNPRGKPVVVLHLRAKNDTNGNPQRLWMIVSDEGRVLEVIDEGYGNLPKRYRDVPEIPIDLRQGQYRDMLRWARDVGREKYAENPSFALSEPIRASIGAAVTATLGAFTTSSPWTIAVWAAVGSLIGSNWKKITAGLRAGGGAYRQTARANNPGASTSALVGRLKF